MGPMMRRLEISHPLHAALVEQSAAELEPAPGELLIAVSLVGLCRTDCELFSGDMAYIRSGQSHYPITPGHEWVGKVAAVGSGVTSFRIGDRVVGECSLGCGSCVWCLTGRYNVCPYRRETGLLGISGAVADFLVFPSRSAFHVPEGVDDRDAVLAEPTAVAMHAVRKLNAPSGASVLIVGAGTVGFLAASVLRAECRDVCVVDLSPTAVERARGIGAREPVANERFLYVIEAAGTAASMRSAVARMKSGGFLVAVGLSGQGEVPFPLDEIVIGELRLEGSVGSPNVWPDVLGLLKTVEMRPSTMVSATYALDDAPWALRELTAGRLKGKILISP